jgi:hypothetical protein
MRQNQFHLLYAVKQNGGFMWVVFWASCSILCSVIANKKGRDEAGWFLLGVLIGPFAILFALAAREDKQLLENRQLRTGRVRKCPFCAELIKREAVVCRHCGNDMPERLNAPTAENNPALDCEHGS